MEEKEIMIKIIGLIIGLIVLTAGIYYLVKEGKNDPESRKIYTVISVIGAAVSVVCTLPLVL